MKGVNIVVSWGNLLIVGIRVGGNHKELGEWGGRTFDKGINLDQLLRAIQSLLTAIVSGQEGGHHSSLSQRGEDDL